MISAAFRYGFLWTFTICIITVKEREPYNIPHYYYPLSWSSLKRLSQTPMMTLFFCKKSQRLLPINNFLQKASFIDFWQGLIYTSDWKNFISIRIQRWDSNWLLVASALQYQSPAIIDSQYIIVEIWFYRRHKVLLSSCL